MDFEFTQDQLELQRTVRDVLDRECPPDVPRAVAEGGAADDLWATLVSLDWPALALPEEVGGIGYSWVELAIVLEELGRAAAPGPFQATITQFAPALSLGTEQQRERWLGQVASGALTGALALDEGAGSWSLDDVAAVASVDGDELVLSGAKRYVLDGHRADEIAVVVRVDDEPRVVIVPGSDLTADVHQAIDPTSVHADLALDGVRVDRQRLLGDGPDPAALEAVVAEATTAVALVTLGACQRILEMVLDYVKEREQFGVPIGSFQAVKHKVADMYRDVERARALAFFAALCLAEDDDRAPLATAMAKASAGECQQRCAQDGLQLFGGIGYTWEHDLHLYLRRAKVGDMTFGGASHHRQAAARLTLNAPT